jgi:hypothetical protein
MYKTLLPVLFAALIFASCGSKSEIRKKLSVAEEVVISFSEKNNPKRKTVSAVEKAAISRMIDFIEKKEDLSNLVCATNDGIILFKKQDTTVQVVTFTYLEKGCQQFYFTMDGKTYKTKVSNEAIDFFTALAAGEDVYW